MNMQGFTLVDTSHFLVGKEWPPQRSRDFKILNSNAFGHYMALSECNTQWVKQLIRWQERLLTRALPTEGLYNRGEGLSLRNERFKNDKVCHWHLDGGYIRSLCVVKGPTTQVMTPLGESPIPLGWTLFITAKDRRKVPATLHRRPRLKNLRRVIVYGWNGVP
jgi:hypothetical protein